MSLDLWLECRHCGGAKGDLNYTHNVTKMWQEAGCYDALYNAEGNRASTQIDAIHRALEEMGRNPAKYKAMNPPNGWGDYDSALKFLGAVYLLFCTNPDMIIGVSK